MVADSGRIREGPEPHVESAMRREHLREQLCVLPFCFLLVSGVALGLDGAHAQRGIWGLSALCSLLCLAPLLLAPGSLLLLAAISRRPPLEDKPHDGR